MRELMLQHGKTNAQGLVDMLPADSERWADVASRALRSVSGWLDRHPDDEILFVCHDAVMQSMAQTLTREFLQEQSRQAVPLCADGGCVGGGRGQLALASELCAAPVRLS